MEFYVLVIASIMAIILGVYSIYVTIANELEMRATIERLEEEAKRDRCFESIKKYTTLK